MIAENILRFRREHPGMKLMVFLPNDAMINPREIADFVAQKATLRQMILDRSAPEKSGYSAREALAATLSRRRSGSTY